MKKFWILGLVVFLLALGTFAVYGKSKEGVKCCVRGKCIQAVSEKECKDRGGDVKTDCRSCR